MVFALIFTVAACTDGKDTETETETTTSYVRENKTKVAVYSGITSLGVSKLVRDRDYAYESSMYTDLGEIESLLKNGGTDIAAVPVEFAAKIYNDTKGGVKIISINNLGALYLVSDDTDIKSLADIGDKTVYASGKGTAFEHILNFIFEKNSIKPRIEYVATDEELVTLAIEGKADLCILPEPIATKVVFENREMKRVVDFAAEWKAASGSGLAQTVIVARTEYIEKNPEYINTFLSQNEISVNFLVDNTDTGANLLHKDNYFSSVDLARECLPNCKLYFIKGDEMKPLVQSVCDALPAEMTGGTVNADGICFVQ